MYSSDRKSLIVRLLRPTARQSGIPSPYPVAGGMLIHEFLFFIIASVNWEDNHFFSFGGCNFVPFWELTKKIQLYLHSYFLDSIFFHTI